MFSTKSSRPSPAALSVAVVAGAVLLAAVFLLAVRFLDPRGGYTGGYVQGFKEARSEAMQSMPQVTKVTTINGTVTRIDGEYITLKAEGLLLNEKVDGVDEMRTVRVTDKTKLISRTAIPPAQLYESMQKDQAPNPFVETDIALSAIKVGDRISVSGMDEQNVLLLASFDASLIAVNVPPAPEAPAPARNPAPTEEE